LTLERRREGGTVLGVEVEDGEALGDEEAREEGDGGGEREGAVGEEPARVEARPAGDPEVGRAQGRRRPPQPRQQRRRGRRGERDERAADEDLPPQPVRRAVRRRQRHRAEGGYPSLGSAWSSRARVRRRVGGWLGLPLPREAIQCDDDGDGWTRRGEGGKWHSCCLCAATVAAAFRLRAGADRGWTWTGSDGLLEAHNWILTSLLTCQIAFFIVVTASFPSREYVAS